MLKYNAIIGENTETRCINLFKKSYDVTDGTIIIPDLSKVISPSVSLKQYDSHVSNILTVTDTLIRSKTNLQRPIAGSTQEMIHLYISYAETSVDFQNMIEASLKSTISFVRNNLTGYIGEEYVDMAEHKINDVLNIYYQISSEWRDNSNNNVQLINRFRNSIGHVSSSLSPMIPFPSLSAVLTNEISSIKNNASVNNLHNRGSSLFETMILNEIAFQKDTLEVISYKLREVFSFVRAKYCSDIVELTGGLSERPAWQAFKNNPMDEKSFIRILEKEPYPGTNLLDILILAFIKKENEELDDAHNRVQQKCISELRERLGGGNYQVVLQENALFIDNISQFSNSEKETVLKTTFSPIISQINQKMVSLCGKIPNSIRQEIYSGNDVGNSITKTLNSIVSLDNLTFLCNNIDISLLERLSFDLFGNKVNDVSVFYDNISRFVSEKSSRAKVIFSEHEKLLKEYNSQIERLTTELKKQGLFAFSRKKEIKKEIGYIEEKIQDAKNSLDNRINEA